MLTHRGGVQTEIQFHKGILGAPRTLTQIYNLRGLGATQSGIGNHPVTIIGRQILIGTQIGITLLIGPTGGQALALRISHSGGTIAVGIHAIGSRSHWIPSRKCTSNGMKILAAGSASKSSDRSSGLK